MAKYIRNINVGITANHYNTTFLTVPLLKVFYTIIKRDLVLSLLYERNQCCDEHVFTCT